MPDDPREILKAAGVECAEVDEFLHDLAPYWCPDCNEEHEREYSELSRRIAGDAVAAILALARLVAKHKWQRDLLVSAISEEWGEGTQESFGLEPESICCGLDAKWESNHAS